LIRLNDHKNLSIASPFHPLVKGSHVDKDLTVFIHHELVALQPFTLLDLVINGWSRIPCQLGEPVKTYITKLYMGGKHRMPFASVWATKPDIGKDISSTSIAMQYSLMHHNRFLFDISQS
jgi:hypothetical protein